MFSLSSTVAPPDTELSSRDAADRRCLRSASSSFTSCCGGRNGRKQRIIKKFPLATQFEQDAMRKMMQARIKLENKGGTTLLLVKVGHAGAYLGGYGPGRPEESRRVGTPQRRFYRGNWRHDFACFSPAANIRNFSLLISVPSANPVGSHVISPNLHTNPTAYSLITIPTI